MDQANGLTTAMNNISLDDEENGGIEIEAGELESGTLQDQGFDAKLCIVGRFIQEGKFDFAAMQQTLAVLWKSGK